MTLRDIYNQVPEPQRTELLEKIRYHWPLNARPAQVPTGTERYQVIVGGRASGKTRAGAEWIREKAREPDQRLILVARTAADVRNVLVEGESGILNVSPPSERPLYIPSMRRLEWANGTHAFCTNWDQPDTLRGLKAHFTWLDEPGHMANSTHSGEFDAFDIADLATHLGYDPQVLITGTSQVGKSPLWDEIATAMIHYAPFRTSHIRMYHNKTLDNQTNLNRSFVEKLLDTYKGTGAEVKELEGLL